MAEVIDPAREHEVIKATAASIKPSSKGSAGVDHQLELNGPAGLLLNGRCTISNANAADEVADLHLDDVASTQFAIDGEVEQGSVPQAPMLIKKEADCPHVSWFQRAFRTHESASVPRSPLTSCRIKI